MDELQGELQSYVYAQMQELREDLVKDMHNIMHDGPGSDGNQPLPRSNRSARSLRNSNSMGSGSSQPLSRDTVRESVKDGEGRRQSTSQSPGGEARRSKKRPTRMTFRSFNSYIGPGSTEGASDHADDTPTPVDFGSAIGPFARGFSNAEPDPVVDMDDNAGKAYDVHDDLDGGDAAAPLLSDKVDRNESKVSRLMKQFTTELEGSWMWEEEDDDPDVPKGVKRSARIQKCMDRCIHSHAFEHMVGIAIVLSSVLLGAEVDYAARNLTSDTPAFYKAVDMLFALFFSLEIGARMYVHRCRFFTMQGKAWNIFDLGMVLLQVIDVSVQMLASLSHFDFEHGGSHVSAMRVLRVLRMVRMLRIFRTFSLFSELRIMVASMSAAVGSLIWSMLLQLVMVYVFAVIFMQVVTGRRRKDDSETLEYWFGSLSRSMLTMTESILGGVSWDEIVNPLIHDISPIMGTLFVFYVAASMFAMMNLVTGVFVTEVLNKVNEDKDESFIHELNGIISGDGNETQITKREFVRRAHMEPAMLKYLKSLDIHPADSNYIFEILDADDNGTLDRQELMEAFLRLRGPARNVDMQVLRREVQDLADRVDLMPIPPVAVEIDGDEVFEAEMDSAAKAGLTANGEDGLQVLTTTIDPSAWPYLVGRMPSPVLEAGAEDALGVVHQFSTRRQRRHGADLLTAMQQDEDGIKATSSLRPPVPVVLTRRVSPNPAASQAVSTNHRASVATVRGEKQETLKIPEEPEAEAAGSSKFRRQNSGHQDLLDSQDVVEEIGPRSSNPSQRRSRRQVPEEAEQEETMMAVMSHKVSGRLRRQASKLLAEEALEAIAMQAHEDDDADSRHMSPATSRRKSQIFSRGNSPEDMAEQADGTTSFGI